MKYTLKDYQDEAVIDVLKNLSIARDLHFPSDCICHAAKLSSLSAVA